MFRADQLIVLHWFRIYNKTNYIPSLHDDSHYSIRQKKRRTPKTRTHYGKHTTAYHTLFIPNTLNGNIDFTVSISAFKQGVKIYSRHQICTTPIGTAYHFCFWAGAVFRVCVTTNVCYHVTVNFVRGHFFLFVKNTKYWVMRLRTKQTSASSRRTLFAWVASVSCKLLQQ